MPEHRVLYADSRYYAAFPSLCRLTDGRLLLAFRRARDPRWLLGAAAGEPGDRDALAAAEVSHLDPRSHQCAMILDDELRVVDGPWMLEADPDAAEQDPSLLAMPDGRLLLASFSWHPFPPPFREYVKAAGGRPYMRRDRTGEAFLLWGTTVRTSEDGRTWTPRQDLPELSGAEPVLAGLRAQHGGAIRGAPVVCGGEILLATYAPVGTLSASISAHAYASRDGGDSWAYRGVIAADPAGAIHFQEPTLCAIGGTVIAMMRTTGADGRLATARSDDGGRTWSAWQLEDVLACPAHALALADGRVLVTYGYRHAPHGVRWRLWDAETGTFGPEHILRDDGTDDDLGYPWAVSLGRDGDLERVAVVYYGDVGAGQRGIAGAIISV